MINSMCFCVILSLITLTALTFSSSLKISLLIRIWHLIKNTKDFTLAKPSYPDRLCLPSREQITTPRACLVLVLISQSLLRGIVINEWLIHDELMNEWLINPLLVSGPVRCLTFRSWWRTASSTCSLPRATSAVWRRRRRSCSWSWMPLGLASGRPATCSRTSRWERATQHKLTHFFLIPLWIIFIGFYLIFFFGDN